VVDEGSLSLPLLLNFSSFAASTALNPFVELKEAVVEKDAAALAHQWLPFLFDPEVEALVFSHLERVDFLERLVEQPGIPFDFVAVNSDGELAQ
jgi:hypothetical protein